MRKITAAFGAVALGVLATGCITEYAEFYESSSSRAFEPTSKVMVLDYYDNNIENAYKDSFSDYLKIGQSNFSADKNVQANPNWELGDYVANADSLYNPYDLDVYARSIGADIVLASRDISAGDIVIDRDTATVKATYHVYYLKNDKGLKPFWTTTKSDYKLDTNTRYSGLWTRIQKKEKGGWTSLKASEREEVEIFHSNGKIVGFEGDELRFYFAKKESGVINGVYIKDGKPSGASMNIDSVGMSVSTMSFLCGGTTYKYERKEK